MEKKYLLEISLNEPQEASFKDAQKKFRGCHNADMLIRADGQDWNYEIDYLRDAFMNAKEITP